MAPGRTYKLHVYTFPPGLFWAPGPGDCLPRLSDRKTSNGSPVLNWPHGITSQNIKNIHKSCLKNRTPRSFASPPLAVLPFPSKGDGQNGQLLSKKNSIGLMASPLRNPQLSSQRYTSRHGSNRNPWMMDCCKPTNQPTNQSISRLFGCMLELACKHTHCVLWRILPVGWFSTLRLWEHPSSISFVGWVVD